MRLCCDDVFHVLKNCPRLKHVDLNSYTPSGSSPRQDGLHELVSFPWACKDLVEVCLNLSEMFPASSPSQQGKDGMAANHEATQGGTQNLDEAFVRLCQHLCTFHKLTMAALVLSKEQLLLALDHGDIVKAIGHTFARVTSAPYLQRPFLLQHCPLFLQSCPRLQEIGLPKISQSLESCCIVHNLLDAAWVCKDLTRVVITVKDDLDSGETLPRLLKRLSTLDRLQTVDLQWITKESLLQINMAMKEGNIKTVKVKGSSPTVVLAKMVCHLFSKCPGLEQLSVDDPSAVNGVPLNEILDTEWVCRNIKILEIPITYHAPVPSTAELDTHQQHH